MNIIVTGGSSGLGKALIIELLNPQFRTIRDNKVFNWSLPKVDVTSRQSIRQALDGVDLKGVKIDVLINCAGINDIDYLPDLTPITFRKVMEVNAFGLFNTVQELLPRLGGGTVINIVSNAAHIPMTASLAYNASKGAALIMTKQMARELKKTHDITVFSVSPNKLAGTGMSNYIERRVQEVRGWTAEQAAAYQLASLPAGAETPPQRVAEFIAFLLSDKERHRYLNGCDLQYGA